MMKREKEVQVKKPVVGVVPLWDDEKESIWMLPGYFDGIQKAGGIPIMLPFTTDQNILAQCIDMCDGILLTGGHDVSPMIYGMEPEVPNLGCKLERDLMESIVLKYALEKEKAVLGICRGIQFLNAYLGGTLYQDLPIQRPSSIEHHQQPPYDVPAHKNIIEKDSPLYRLLNKEEIMVNSYHHQAIKDIAPDLIPMAISEDGIVEAVYMPSKKYVWAFQWHPEFSFQSDGDSMEIFRSFINALSESSLK